MHGVIALVHYKFSVIAFVRDILTVNALVHLVFLIDLTCRRHCPLRFRHELQFLLVLTEVIFLRMALKEQVAKVARRVPSGKS